MKQIVHKYRKSHKVRVLPFEKDYKRLVLLYGFIGLRALSCGRMTFGQSESIRRTIKKVIKKNGTLWFRVFLDRALTAKPAEVRMGKGKGAFSENIAVIKRGTVLVELGGPLFIEKKAIEGLKQVQKKLPFETEIIYFKA